MTNFDPNQYIEIQRQDWNRVAQAWDKWDAWLDTSMSVCNKQLVERAFVSLGSSVLDLGSGTGYPALLAAQRAGETGTVIGLDLAEEMLHVARRKATALGLKRVVFRACDVASIPYEDSSFDAVVSRFCLMFLPHLEKTLCEVFRVLKPGGSFAAAVWAAVEKNPYLVIPMNVIERYLDLPPPDPLLPGIFRLAKHGDLANQMKMVGFTNIIEEEIAIEGIFSSGQEYLDCIKEMAAPLQNLFWKLPADKRDEVEDNIVKSAESFRQGDSVHLPGVALVVSGIKQ